MPRITHRKKIKETLQPSGRWYIVRGFRCRRKDGEPDGEIEGYLVNGKLIPGAPPGEDNDGSRDTDSDLAGSDRG